MNHRIISLSVALVAILLVTPLAVGDTGTLTNDELATEMSAFADLDGSEAGFVSHPSPHPLTGLVAALGPAEGEAPAEAESLWTGKLEFGAFYTDGNTHRRGGHIGLSATRETEDAKYTAKALATYAEDTGLRSTNEQFASLRKDWKMDPWYLFALLSVERDEFERIDYRAIFAPGAGRNLVNDPGFVLDVELGPTATYINYKNVDGKRRQTEKYEGWTDEDAKYEVGFRIAFHAEIDVFESAKITEDLEIFPSLIHGGEFRAISETAFTQPLSEAWYFKLSVIDRYNSQAIGDTKKNDVEVLLSLVYSF